MILPSFSLETIPNSEVSVLGDGPGGPISVSIGKYCSL